MKYFIWLFVGLIIMLSYVFTNQFTKEWYITWMLICLYGIIDNFWEGQE